MDYVAGIQLIYLADIFNPLVILCITSVPSFIIKKAFF